MTDIPVTASAASAVAVQQSPSRGSRATTRYPRAVADVHSARPLSGPAAVTWRLREPGALPPRRRPATSAARVLQPELPFECVQQSGSRGADSWPAAADAATRDICARLLLLTAQTALGLRPVHQAIRWTTARVYADLQRKHMRATAVHRTGSRAPATFALVGLRAQVVGGRMVECCAVAVTGGRSGGFNYRAVAIRVVKHDGGWWVTELEM